MATVQLSPTEEVVGGKQRNIAQEEHGQALLDQVAAIFREDVIYALADAVPSSTIGAASRRYPLYLWFGINALNDVFTSNRSTFTQLHATVDAFWTLIRTTVAERFPGAPEMHLPDKPPCRTWYHHTRARLIEPAWPQITEAFTATSISLLPSVGLCDPDGPGSRTAPSLDRLLYADGKIVTPITSNPKDATREVKIVDKATKAVRIAKVPVRHDPDASNFVDGARRQVHGNKFLQIGVRSEDPHVRLILAIDEVPSEKGGANSENHKLVEHFIALAPKIPGALAVVTDGVLRGADRAAIIRETGWIVVNPPAAASASSATKKRTEKEGPYEIVNVSGPGGQSRAIEIFHRAGGLCEKVVDGDGRAHLVPLARVDRELRENLDGTFRDYVIYKVPNPFDDSAPIRLRASTITSEKDRARGFNRSELIHQIPKADAAYADLYGRRQDAESNNRDLDDHLPLRRARSYGRRRQLLDLLGHAVRVNCYAVSSLRRRRPAEAA